MLYTFLRTILNPILRLMFKIEVIGDNNLDENKPYIIASNHISNFDPLLVIITFNKRKIHFIGKKELFENKILKFILDRVYVIPIDRSKTDLTAIKKCYKVLKNNEILGIFPQGTRVKNKEDGSAKAGIGMFAIRTNTPVIPISIIPENNYKLFSKIKIIYHEPYYVREQILEEKNNDNYLLVSNEIMNIIKG